MRWKHRPVRASRLLLSVAVGLGAGVVACEAELEPVPLESLSEEIWDAYCVPMNEHACWEPWEEINLCTRVDELPARIQALLDDGAVWDGECMATLLDHLDRRGNEDAPPGAYAGCNRPCRPLHGRLQAGETCGVSQRYAQCDAGLECFDSRCVDPCAVPVAVGGSCLTAPCEEGARCDFDTRICVHGNAVRCGQGHCAPGQYCIDAECFDPIPTGEACTGHRQCDTRYCPAGYCLPRPEAGEACPADVCAEGLTCDSGTCELEPDGPDELQARVCQLPLALPEPEPLGD